MHAIIRQLAAAFVLGPTAGCLNRSSLPEADARLTKPASTHQGITLPDSPSLPKPDASGLAPVNDPALQLLMVAALQGHGFRWQTGEDKLLLISIGTGTYKRTFSTEELLNMVSAAQGLRALQSLMDDCAHVNHALLQWLSHTITPWTIDRAVGDMKLDSQSGPRLATYARYNVLLEQNWLKTEVEIEYRPEKLAKIAEMDNPAGMDDLAEIGAKAAAKQVKAEHFPPGFDIHN